MPENMNLIQAIISVINKECLKQAEDIYVRGEL